MAFLVRFCRYEVLIGRKLTLIVVRRVDYERSAVLDDLKYDVLLVTLQNGFDGIVENVSDYRYEIAVAYLNVLQIVSDKGNDDALLFCFEILDVQYGIDKRVAGIDNVNALNLFSQLLFNIPDLLFGLAFAGKHEHNVKVIDIVM